MKKKKGPGKGWHGDSERHAKAGAVGGKAWKNPKNKERASLEYQQREKERIEELNTPDFGS